MSSKRKCGPFPFVLLLKDMTDGSVDARLDFVFIKAHTRGDTGCTGWGRVSLLLSPFSEFTHSVLLFCPASDVSTLTHVFHQCTLPCLWGHGHISFIGTQMYLSDIFTTGLSHYTETKDFSEPLTTRVFICFLISLWCLDLQLLSILGLFNKIS